ncbi:hypothetical protein JRC04_22435 [Mycolicibacterium sp. S2-37]|uniref:hypothetical protein n=1 Tax=Mycolicibacterium sp. S2-37 TaxID=2810297 RepID=UPI001A93EA44|nr:hypothetical protein [Mycolicibacterium sp. S2-37]MBO0680232.1 hypothetical protein [Mycolicibacterium sp. S2-37]
MTARKRTGGAARLALAAAVVGLGALALPGLASAQPVPPPVPGPPPPAPPPAGAPFVPQVPNAQYGSGDGPLGFLRDAWHQARDPYNFGGTAPGMMPPPAAPPPGAGPPPPLPPGYTSMTAPESSTPAVAPATGGPPLPPGYYPLNGPPPPGYFDAPPAPPAPPGPVVPPKIDATQ